MERPDKRPDNRMVDKPRYKALYQNELAEELTGRSRETIRKLMKRKEITLAQAIKYYLKKNEYIL